MNKWVLPGEGDDFLGESKELREVLLALVVDEVVEILPVEDEFHKASVLERPEEGPDMDVGNVGALVGLHGEILMNHDDSLLQQVAVHGLLLGFLNLHHCG